MNISFAGKTAVVTGGTSGIGKVVSQQLLEAGATVITVGRDKTKIAEMLATYTGSLSFYPCELEDHEQILWVFGQIEERFGQITILVNNAGVQTYGNVVTTDEHVWDFTMNVNLKSAYLCAKYAIPLMKGVKDAVVINVGSVQGFVSQANVSAYAASKEALHGLTRSIAIDFAPHIRCVAVCPGAVMTPMLEQDIEAFDDRDAIITKTENIHLLRRIAEPAEIANVITFLASDKASFITGQTFRVDGGIGLMIQGT